MIPVGEKTVTPAKGSALYRNEGQHMGSMIPFADPMWMQDWYSPYYNESHFRLAKYCREFVDAEVAPNVETWEENLGVTPEIYKRFGELGLLALEHAPGIYQYLPPNFPRPVGLKDNEIGW